MNDTLITLSGGLAGIVKAGKRLVVRVETRHGAPSSGVVWSEGGIVVTTLPHHGELEGAEVGLDDLTDAAASPVGVDPSTGIAVLRVEGKSLSEPVAADPGSLEVGNLAVALGRPGRSARSALGVLSALGDGWTTQWGGRVDRYIEPGISFPPGFSGGPLLDMEGRLIGINSGGIARGMVLTIPCSTLRRVVDSILAEGRVRRGYLGVGTHPVLLPPALAKASGRRSGLILLSVEEGSPAARAGLLLGDVILEIGGRTLSRVQDLLSFLSETPPGSAFTARVLRSGETRELQVAVGERS